MDYLYRNDDDSRRRSKYRDDRSSSTGGGGGYGGRYDAKAYHDRDDNGSGGGGDSRRRSRSRSRSREDRGSFREYSGPKRFENREGGGGRYQQTPTKSVMVRQIPLHLSEDDLRTEFNMVQLPYKHIRLVKHRENDQSRGFAFIQFGTVEEASRWMASTQGQFQLRNTDACLSLFYSYTDEHTFRSDGISGRRPYNPNSSEWICVKCDVKNFKRRDRCFKCNLSREESEKRTGGEGYEHVGTTPCNTLILRGLDALTVEETIMDTLKRLSNHMLAVKTCHIARDPGTHVSDGFAIVEMNTIQDATYMLQVLAPFFEVDGKQITANYSKNSFKTVITQLQQQGSATTSAAYPSYSAAAAAAVAGAQLQRGALPASQGDRVNSAAAVAQAALINMHKKQEIVNQFTSSLKQQDTSSADGEEAKSAASLDSSIGANLQLLAQQGKTYPPPDPSKFTYDKASGYHYDFTTGFHYHAASQYYYNSLTQQFMYWDPATFTYVPVAAAVSAAGAATSSAGAANPAVEEATTTTTTTASTEATEKAPAATASKPAKTAAQIAKDMERWAQSQNKKKEVTKKATTTTSSIATSSAVSSSSSGGVSSAVSTEGFKPGLFDTKISLSLSSSFDNNLKKTQTITTPTPTTQAFATTLAGDDADAISNSDSDSGGEQRPEPARVEPSVVASSSAVVEEASFIDEAKMACLLCKRRFDTLDILNKHVAKSDLHRTNLEKFRKEAAATTPSQRSQAEQDSLAAALQYRDRAKERRQKFGTPEPPSPKQQQAASAPSSSSRAAKSAPRGDYDQSADRQGSSSSSSGDSIANKLMRKMGWNGESGLGKNMQGISAPIEVTMRQRNAGLGAAGYTIDPNDTYQDAVKKAARARFEQLNSSS